MFPISNTKPETFYVCEYMYIAKDKGKSCVCCVPYDNDDSQNYVFLLLVLSCVSLRSLCV